jgi:hypothetical protein
MSPINPRPAGRELRSLLSAADRNTLSAAGFIVTQRVPLEMLATRLESIAAIIAAYPRTHMAAQLRPEIHNALYLLDLLMEER